LQSFFDDANDDAMSSYDGEIYSAQAVRVTSSPQGTFDAYRLPRTSASLKFSIHAPDVFPDADGQELSTGSLLDKPIDNGLDSFAHDLRWMVDTISARQM
jgi:hypothetical protein